MSRTSVISTKSIQQPECGSSRAAITCAHSAQCIQRDSVIRKRTMAEEQEQNTGNTLLPQTKTKENE